MLHGGVCHTHGGQGEFRHLVVACLRVTHSSHLGCVPELGCFGASSYFPLLSSGFLFFSLLLIFGGDQTILLRTFRGRLKPGEDSEIWHSQPTGISQLLSHQKAINIILMPKVKHIQCRKVKEYRKINWYSEYTVEVLTLSSPTSFPLACTHCTNAYINRYIIYNPKVSHFLK